jgi:hypothetical protein
MRESARHKRRTSPAVGALGRTMHLQRDPGLTKRSARFYPPGVAAPAARLVHSDILSSWAAGLAALALVGCSNSPKHSVLGAGEAGGGAGDVVDAGSAGKQGASAGTGPGRGKGAAGGGGRAGSGPAGAGAAGAGHGGSKAVAAGAGGMPLHDEAGASGRDNPGVGGISGTGDAGASAGVGAAGSSNAGSVAAGAGGGVVAGRGGAGRGAAGRGGAGSSAAGMGAAGMGAAGSSGGAAAVGGAGAGGSAGGSAGVCTACESARQGNADTCRNAASACAQLQGNTASDSPMPNVAKADLCQQLLACEHSTKCAVDQVSDCLCGPGVDPVACFPSWTLAQAGGACKDLIAASAETSDLSEIAVRISDVSYASGAAHAVIETCDYQFCFDQCLL